MRKWNFDNDDGRNPKMEIAQKYVLKWETMMEQNYGLMFIGDVLHLGFVNIELIRL